MTAQVPDTVRLDGGEPLPIVGIDGRGLFDPAEQALIPAMIDTACWRGYVCGYAVDDGRLILEELHLGAHTRIAGQPIAPGTALLGGRAAKQTISRGGGFGYENLNAPMPFTGGLLLGQGFIRSTYVHMGFHPAWKFERVTELLLDEGRLRETRDRSADAALYRSAIEAGEADPDGAADLDPVPDSVAWIERAFSLDYRRSFGD